MKSQLYASTYDRLRGEPTWRLLSANTAPEVLALLRQLLFENDRVLPGAVLTERLTTELSILRSNGRELAGSAAYYLRDWVTSGWLERRGSGSVDKAVEISGRLALRVGNKRLHIGGQRAHDIEDCDSTSGACRRLCSLLSCKGPEA